MTMKILFLDIDGVCNCVSTRGIEVHMFPIDPAMAARVAKIIANTECEVVLSSSWRFSKEGVQAVKDRICPLLDVTGDERRIRGFEITEWLEKHPEVTRYAILDDNFDAGFLHKGNFFKTTWEKGLTDRITNRVITHLNK